MTAAVLALALVRSAEAGPLPAAAGQASQQSAAATVQPLQQPARPYRGLFGAGSAAAPGGHLLDLTTFIYAEYGTNADTEFTPGGEPVEGWFTGLRGRLSFEKAGRNARMALRGEGALRYYPDSGQTSSPRLRTELAVDARTGARFQNSVRFTGSFDYEPYYILSIFPTAVLPTGDVAVLPTDRDDLLFRRTRYIYSQSFSYEHQVTRRSYLSLFEDTRSTKAETAALDVTNLRAGARYGYRMSQYSAFRLGYAYKTGRYGLDATQRIDAHDIDLSVDYRKPLTQSRRTSVGFAAGSSLVTAGPDEQWSVVATANLRHEFSRGWYLQGDFMRNLQLVEGFASPFFVNTASASTGGFLVRRLEVSASGGYSWGSVGFGSDSYTSLQGSARMRLALARYLAIDAEGLINQFGFDNQVVVSGVVPASLNRWSVRANIALWLPLSR